MLRITLKGVRGHLLRFILTAVAVALGVSFVAGTYVLTDSIKATFNEILDASAKDLQVTVRAKEVSDDIPRSNVSLTLVDTLNKVEGIDKAIPSYQGESILVGKSGTAVGGNGAPSYGFAYRSDDSTLKMEKGRAPQGPGEVVVEASTLKRSKLAIGDTAKVLVQGEPHTEKIVGEVSFDSKLAGATILLYDENTARTFFSPDGKVPSIALKAAPGVSQDQLRDAAMKVLPKSVEAVTAEAIRQEAEDEMDSSLGFISTFLMVFAAIGLFVGSFLIANTFSMLVARRVRELALLRAVGASRGQVLRVVLGEATVIGSVGSVIGLGAGVGLAAGLLELLADQSGSDVGTGTPVTVRTVVTCLIVGILVTVLSALVPALRASRIAPVDALRDDIAITPKGARIRGAIGIAMVALGTALLAGQVTSDSPNWSAIGFGALLVVTGAVLAAPLTARPVMHVVCWPFVLVLGVVGRLARQNTLRNPRRTASTASALMIGLALIAGVGVIAESMKASVAGMVEDQLHSDFVLSSKGQTVIAPSVAPKAKALPGVQSVLPMGIVDIRPAKGGRLTGLTGNGKGLLDNVRMTMASGQLASVDQGKVLVPEEMAEEKSWRVGSTITATVGSAVGQKLVVGGTFKKNEVIGETLIVPDWVYKVGVPPTQRGEYYIMVKAAAGTDLAALRAGLESLVKQYIVVSVQDSEEFTQSYAEQVDQMLMILYGLLGLSVIIAVLGIFNTLAMSVFERTREIGLLRAVGLGRSQLSGVMTIEAVATAVFGALLGSAVGLGLGVAVQKALVSDGLTVLSIPWTTIAILVAFSGVVGVLASVIPTVRAIRLDVLRAITTE